MPELLNLSENASKQQRYSELLPQIKSLIEDEKNTTANLANISAALKEAFKFWWVGFYLVDNEDSNQLVLGPFQASLFRNIFLLISLRYCYRPVTKNSRNLPMVPRVIHLSPTLHIDTISTKCANGR